MRSIFALSITFFLLTACSPTQVTATLPPTITPLPIPMGTPVPTATVTVIPTPTAEKTPAQLWAERPIKEYPWCADVAQFDKYFVPPNKLQDQADFVQENLTPDLFTPAKFNIVSEYQVVGDYLIPSPFDDPPHFEEPGSAPFLKDTMLGITELDGKTYLVTQVPYFVEGVPANERPVMTGLREVDPNRKGTWSLVAGYYKDDMNLIPWNVTDFSIATKFINPKTGLNFTREEVQTIIGEMKEGNFSNTHGLVLKFDIALMGGGWYK